MYNGFRYQPHQAQKRAKRYSSALFCAFCLPLYLLWLVPESLGQTVEVGLRQIVVASEQEARAVRSSLMAGASFEALATAPRGGYLGRIRLSDLRNEVRIALETVVPGGVTNPIQVGNTYVLFKIVHEA